jgi:hypothetical protein
MKSSTPAQIADTTAPVRTPGYLVELLFSVPLRLSTRGDQSWNGYTWTGGRIGKISGLASDGRGEQKGRIELINSDLAYGALVLNEGWADRGCRVWEFYGNNPADARLVLDGVGDVAEINPDSGRVSLSVVGESLRTAQFPGRVIGRATGFNHLKPAGSKLTWGGQTYILEPGKY